MTRSPTGPPIKFYALNLKDLRANELQGHVGTILNYEAEPPVRQKEELKRFLETISARETECGVSTCMLYMLENEAINET